jgi:hypothetical protein
MMLEIQWDLNTEAAFNYNPDEFWYDITESGCIEENKLLNDATQIAMVHNAVELLMSFEKELREYDK